MRIAAVLLLALAFVAAAGAAPPAPPPKGPSSGPPAAWIHTAHGDRWLAWSSYCWGGRCADYLPPSCTGRFPAPRVPVRLGERVTIHLRFRAQGIFVAERGTAVHGKATATAVTVPVRRLGVLTVGARRAGAPGGDALYAGCLVRRPA
jgi:hypothetical protein